MAQPRRAAQPPHRRRWLVGLSLAVLLAVAALVLAPRLGSDLGEVSSPAPAGSTSVETRPSPPTSTSSGSPQQPTASTTAPPAGEDSTKVLDACREQVAAGDRVLASARTGMKHWSQHVQAQIDADAGRITVADMDATFSRTRASGPEDVRQYDGAVRTLRRSAGSCDKPRGVTSEVATRLKACAARQDAQRPVLGAAEDGMSDWKQHLTDMRRSDQGMISQPAKRWQETYRAAPAHIDAYRRAVDGFDAPRC